MTAVWDTMTLNVGDHLVIKRGGKVVEGEAYREFEVTRVGWITYPDGTAGYRVELKVIE